MLGILMTSIFSRLRSFPRCYWWCGCRFVLITCFQSYFVKISGIIHNMIKGKSRKPQLPTNTNIPNTSSKLRRARATAHCIFNALALRYNQPVRRAASDFYFPFPCHFLGFIRFGLFRWTWITVTHICIRVLLYIHFVHPNTLHKTDHFRAKLYKAFH